MAPDSIDLTWDAWTGREWDRYLAAAGLSTLEQSWAYGEALAAVEGCRVRRALVTRDGRPLAMVQAFEKHRFLPLAVLRILRGPLWLEPGLAPKGRQDVLHLVKRQFRLARRELLIWSPELVEGPESHALMRGCGTRRMVTGYSTLVLDLQRPASACGSPPAGGASTGWSSGPRPSAAAGSSARRASWCGPSPGPCRTKRMSWC
jgi:hypothetical protein